MTTQDIVDALKGRPSGGNRWMACCPIHEEKTGSLSIKAGAKATLLYCFGCGAKSAQIMGALGFKPQDVFYDAGTKMTPEQSAARNAKRKQEEVLARLNLRWARCLWAVYAYPSERRYRLLLERNAWRAMMHQELEMDPERKARYELAKRVRSIGFDALWENLENSSEWQAMMAEVSR